MNWVQRQMARLLKLNAETPRTTDAVRARPGQKYESNFAYARGTDADENLAWFALNAWVATAVDELASASAVAPLEVRLKAEKTKKMESHPLLDLLGVYGRPNDYQDTLEFMELHYTDYLLAGNSFWYMTSPFGGAPSEIHILDPRSVQVVPGSDRLVSHYVYTVGGAQLKLDPLQVIHHKRVNPFSPYVGLSAMEALKIEVRSDRSMAQWNLEFFSVGQPSGILIIDPAVPNDERDRVADELNARHSERRQVAVVRAAVGSSVWNDAGLKHHELDFESGRLLSRQAVYERLGLPVGMMSEASTEAHARVAERRLLASVWRYNNRTASRMQPMLTFWPGAIRYFVQFQDMRVQDWQQQQQRITAESGYKTVDELRSDASLPALPDGEVPAKYFRPANDAKNMTATGADNVIPLTKSG